MFLEKKNQWGKKRAKSKSEGKEGGEEKKIWSSKKQTTSIHRTLGTALVASREKRKDAGRLNLLTSWTTRHSFAKVK